MHFDFLELDFSERNNINRVMVEFEGGNEQKEKKKVLVEVMYWRDCPSWELALERVRKATFELEKEHNTKFEIREVEVKDDEEAERIGFPGSPTIKVNGKDIDPEGAEKNVKGLTCRVYNIDGKFLPLPPYEFIKQRIKELSLSEK